MDGVDSVTAPLPARQMQATHDGGLGARGHLAAAAARARAALAAGAGASSGAWRREIQVTLHEDGLVELLALKQRMDEISLPGVSAPRELRRGAAQIKPGDVVLDPFCSKATFLAEAALLAGGVGDRRRLGPGAT